MKVVGSLEQSYIGTVLYFNTALNEYKVSFTDGTFAYISKEDIDGIEIAFLDEKA